ncbi:MAG: glycerate kinase, partial [Bacteroidales bacterium]|nr:glycerate kinase [Bacteroidales bacterium]
MALQNQNIRKILIAPDKFKGSLTSSQAAMAIRRGLESAALPGNGGLQFRMVEIADGGDGSLEVVGKKVADGRIVQCEASDPVGVRRPVEYLIYMQGGKVCAFIEMAKVCGLAQLDPALRNPLRTSTYGLGEVILDAARNGAVSITLSIGGSATDDCGAGMLQALGYQFTGAAGELLPVPVCGGDLERVVGIKEPKEKQWGNVEVICDVTNPLLGPNGATAVYAPQKGADSAALGNLEAGKRSFTGVAERCLGVAAACKEQPGAGAAGGVGYAGLAFL